MNVVNPNITSRWHRIGVLLTPLVVGTFGVVVQAMSAQEWSETSWWLLGSAISTGLLTAYLNWVRGTSPQ